MYSSLVPQHHYFSCHHFGLLTASKALQAEPSENGAVLSHGMRFQVPSERPCPLPLPSSPSSCILPRAWLNSEWQQSHKEQCKGKSKLPQLISSSGGSSWEEIAIRVCLFDSSLGYSTQAKCAGNLPFELSPVEWQQFKLFLYFTINH